MASKLVIHRVRQASQLCSAVHVHGSRAAEALRKVLEPTLGDGAVDAGPLLAQLAAKVAAERDELVARDEAAFGEKVEARKPRRRRDKLARDLYGRVGRLRATLDGIYGKGESRWLLGLKGKTSQDPLVLHRQASRIVAQCRDPETSWPEAGFASLAFTPEVCAAELEPAVEALGQAIDEVAAAYRAVEDTVIAKNQALERFDRTYLHAGQIIESIFRMAGLERMADKVRPRRRKGRQRKEPMEITSAAASQASGGGIPDPLAAAPADDAPEPLQDRPRPFLRIV